jgi:hypothetical protein
MATKINKTKLEKDIKVLVNNLTLLDKEIKKLSANLNKMMDGDADGPYWNGGKAQVYYRAAVNNLSNNIEDYVKAYNKLNAISIKYAKLKKNDK